MRGLLADMPAAGKDSNLPAWSREDRRQYGSLLRVDCVLSIYQLMDKWSNIKSILKKK